MTISLLLLVEVMENHNMSVCIEKNNCKEDGVSSIITDTEEDPSLQPLLTFREKLCKLFESHKFQIAIIVLVLIDSLIVIAELILEAKHHEMSSSNVPHVLHYMSIGILSIFIVEILFKLYAFRLEFFHHKFEIFDAFVVFLSFALDVSFWEQEGIDLIIVLRLWRVARILNGVVLSVKTQAEHKLMKERHLREGIEQELVKCRLYTNALEQEVEQLRSLLKKHNVKEIPPSVIGSEDPPVAPNTISVIAEVNQVHSV